MTTKLRTSFTSPILVLALALCAGHDAAAQDPFAEGGQGWNMFQIILTDLDPTDGITPELAWASQFTYLENNHDGTVISAQADNWTAPLTVSQDGNVVDAGADHLEMAASTASFVELLAERGGTFWLTRKTRVEFRLPYGLRAEAAPTLDIQGQAALELSIPDTYSDVDERLITNGQTDTGTLSVAWENLDTEAASGHLMASLHIQAIPEPRVHALLLAGLGLVGWMGWRRGRLSARP